MAINFLNTVAVDENVLFVDTVNDRVGIGTTTPQRELDVFGGVRIRGTLDLFQENDNTFAGTNAGNLFNIVSSANTGFGEGSQAAQLNGNSNSSLGFDSLAVSANGNNNTAIGTSSMALSNGGSFNTALGSSSLSAATLGQGNTAIGFSSLANKTTSNFNTAIGNNSLKGITTGFRNTAVGNDAGKLITDGVTLNSTGRNSIFIGDSTKAKADNQTNQIVIGVGAIGNGSNTTTIGNADTVSTEIKGNVGIGTTTPDVKLDVSGTTNTTSLSVGILHTNYSSAIYNTNLGFENFNNGFAALATGQLTLADAALSTSMGYQCKALGVASLAGGNTNSSTLTEAAGDASVAFGNGVKTSSNANYSQAFGRGTITGGGNITANQAMAIGFETTAWADNSFAGGNDTNAFGEQSFAFGAGTTASKGDSNIALGLGVTTNTNSTTAIGAGQVVVGKFNNYSSNIAHNFAVGTGLSNNARVTGFCVTNVGYSGMGMENPASKLDILSSSNTNNSTVLRVRTSNNPNAPEKVVGFYVNTVTERGFISVNQYATAYSTSSDYRLKENIIPIHNSIERLKELKPSRFNFIGTDPTNTVDGFIAHEAAEVVPESVTGEKDAVDEDNNPAYQGIDQSKIVPLLTAALQEAVSKIEQLETRIQTLENN